MPASRTARTATRPSPYARPAAREERRGSFFGRALEIATAPFTYLLGGDEAEAEGAANGVAAPVSEGVEQPGLARGLPSFALPAASADEQPVERAERAAAAATPVATPPASLPGYTSVPNSLSARGLREGDRVQVRDDGEWAGGVVAGFDEAGRPCVVKDGWHDAFVWRECRLTESGATGSPAPLAGAAASSSSSAAAGPSSSSAAVPLHVPAARPSAAPSLCAPAPAAAAAQWPAALMPPAAAAASQRQEWDAESVRRATVDLVRQRVAKERRRPYPFEAVPPALAYPQLAAGEERPGEPGVSAFQTPLSIAAALRDAERVALRQPAGWYGALGPGARAAPAPRFRLCDFAAPPTAPSSLPPLQPLGAASRAAATEAAREAPLHVGDRVEARDAGGRVDGGRVSMVG